MVLAIETPQSGVRALVEAEVGSVDVGATPEHLARPGDLDALTVLLGAAEQRGPARTVHLPGPAGTLVQRAVGSPCADAPVPARVLDTSDVTTRLALDSPLGRRGSR